MELHKVCVKDETVDRETPLGFWRYAPEFTEAAKHLNIQDRTSFFIINPFYKKRIWSISRPASSNILKYPVLLTGMSHY